MGSCHGPVTVEASSSTVRPVHSTLREYLSTYPTLLHRLHPAIAEVCLLCLILDRSAIFANSVSCPSNSTPSGIRFLLLMEVHGNQGGGKSQIIRTEAFVRFDEHVSAQLLLLRYSYDRISGPYFNRLGGPGGFTGIPGAAFLGIAGVRTAILVIIALLIRPFASPLHSSSLAARHTPIP